jgi:hypothetical protein
MKFGNEFWLILFREYISPNLFAVWLIPPVRSLSVSFLSRKSLIAAKNETKEKGWIGERDTQTVRVNEATAAWPEATVCHRPRRLSGV